MLSIDTNILLHGFNEDSVRHEAAAQWLEYIAQEEGVAISELILAEEPHLSVSAINLHDDAASVCPPPPLFCQKLPFMLTSAVFIDASHNCDP